MDYHDWGIFQGAGGLYYAQRVAPIAVPGGGVQQRVARSPYQPTMYQMQTWVDTQGPMFYANFIAQQSAAVNQAAAAQAQLAQVLPATVAAPVATATVPSSLPTSSMTAAQKQAAINQLDALIAQYGDGTQSTTVTKTDAASAMLPARPAARSAMPIAVIGVVAVVAVLALINLRRPSTAS